MTHLESLLKKFDGLLNDQVANRLERMPNKEQHVINSTFRVLIGNELKAFLTSALQDTLKMVVPEEKVLDSMLKNDEQSVCEEYGWNACREEMLERIRKAGL